MNYRIDELIYKPGFYAFDPKNRKEWFRSGFFEYDVTRLLAAEQTGRLSPYLHNVSVTECISFFGKPFLPATHIEEADLSRPLLMAELSPFSYILVDGYHRLAKAAAHQIETLPAYCLPAKFAAEFLCKEKQYLEFTSYWNGKAYDYERIPAYGGQFCPVRTKEKVRMLDPDRLWKRLEKCMAECPRIELVCDAGQNLWFSVFRLNDKLYCGEADAHRSAACAQPFRLLPKHLTEVLPSFAEGLSIFLDGKKFSLPQLRHADMILAVIRVFSQQPVSRARKSSAASAGCRTE